MSWRLLSRVRLRAPKETELQQAEARLRQVAAPEQFANHPTRSELDRFAAGQYPEGDPKIKAIFEHLHDCEDCLATMAEIRGRARPLEQPTVLGRYRLLVSALVVLVLAAIFFLALRAPKPSPIATVDLRQVTRGQEGSSIIVSRESPAIRVVLPVGGATGNYEIGIFTSATPSAPVLLSSAESRIEDGDEVIAVSIPLNKLKPGPYLLGVRSGSSEWSQYAINIR